jgi:hypothetical protein
LLIRFLPMNADIPKLKFPWVKLDKKKANYLGTYLFDGYFFLLALLTLMQHVWFYFSLCSLCMKGILVFYNTMTAEVMRGYRPMFGEYWYDWLELLPVNWNKHGFSQWEAVQCCQRPGLLFLVTGHSFISLKTK